MELQTLMSTFSFKGKFCYFIKLLQYTEAMQKYNNKSLFFDQVSTILENKIPKHQRVIYC